MADEKNRFKDMAGLAVSEEILAGTFFNGCVAYCILEIRDDESGTEVYALLDDHGKPALGKKRDGADAWEIQPKTAISQLLSSLGVPQKLQSVAEDFLFGTKERINGDDLQDLYAYALIMSPVAPSWEALWDLCFEKYLEVKDQKANRRKLYGLLRDLRSLEKLIGEMKFAGGFGGSFDPP
jgi:hypothetical protein